ncbi:MAG: selenium-dependent xanthine dehydrogenase, partial [Spirochaetales bacterium]
LTALKACITGDTGAYASVGGKVLERAAGHATGAYHIPAAHIDARAVYTNNAPCGAMRGFGVNQVTFAIESCIDELCEKGGFDKWQFRYDNALTEGSVTATGQLLESGVGVRACLEALKPAYDTYDCTGLACGIKNCGIGNGMIDDCGVVIEIAAGGRVMLHHGWTEMGQGVDTVVRRIFCDETGVDPSLVDVKVSTVYEARAGMTTASRASVLAGNAMLDAAAKAEKDIREKGLAALAGREYRGYWKCDWTTKPGAPGPAVTHFGYGYAAQLVVLDNEGNIAKIIAAHDAGRVLNPVLFEGQVEGALLMGLGYALSENLPMEGGRFLSYKMKDLGLLRAGDVPPMEVIAVEVPDAVGPYGAKGVGEIGLVPTAAAYANAWYQFSGERLHHLPRKGGKR